MKKLNVRLARTRSHPGVRGAQKAPRSFRMISAVSGSQGPRPPPSGGGPPRASCAAQGDILRTSHPCVNNFFTILGKFFRQTPLAARENALRLPAIDKTPDRTSYGPSSATAIVTCRCPYGSSNAAAIAKSCLYTSVTQAYSIFRQRASPRVLHNVYKEESAVPPFRAAPRLLKRDRGNACYFATMLTRRPAT